MRKLLSILLFVCLLSIPALALADNGDQLAGEELLYNGDFSVQVESEELPAGWELRAYQNDADSVSATVATEDNTTQIVLTNKVANDARVAQDVTVQPNTVYRLSAEIRTSDVENGTGANLSIDNYPIDKTYCYSENLFGSDSWREVMLYFRTAAEQTKVSVALRLGGYGTTATGTAEFRNVSLYECTATENAIVNLATENGTVSNHTDASTAATTAATANDPLYLAVAFTLALGVAFFWFYRNKLRYSSAAEETVGKPQLALMIILIGMFIFRMVLSLIFRGHPTDINCFMSWGNMVLDVGADKFYTSGAFTDYPPGYMYICGGLAGLCRLLGIPNNSDAMALLFKLPSTFADMATVYLLYRLAKKNNIGEKGALTIAGIYAFTPTLMFVSGAWGQIDSVLSLLIVGTILLLQSDRRILAGAVYGFAILLKPQALMFGPILAVAFIVDIIDHREQWKEKLFETALAVVAALAVIFVLALPFQGDQNVLWLFSKYKDTATSYHYASIEAYNLGSMLGWNWKTADTRILWMPYYQFGTWMIILSVLFSSALYFLGRKRNRGALSLAAGLGVLLIFTFGHYMHERYMIPALLLILLAYLYYGDRRLLAAFGGLSTTSLLNVLCAFYVVNHPDSRGHVYDVITFIGSLGTVVMAVYLSVISVQILALDRIPQPLRLEELPKKRLPRRVSILPTIPTDNKLHYTKKDIFFVLAITLVYGVVALTNLGSTSAPQTYWYSEKAGESITVHFPKVERVTAYSVYGNIDTDGTLLLATADGHQETFDQKYDDMFRWKKTTTDFVSDSVTISLYSGTLKLNELAFFDTNGERIPVTVTGAEGTQANLFDEQDTVAAVPSYYNGMYFDELYHARTAYENLHNLTPYENSHPPLGKLLIMLGVWVFGMVPFGWRVVGALFGIGMLPVLYAFGKRLFRNSDYAMVLTTLFAFDFMHFTQTRIATIDVYSVFFILLMYYYMYQYITMNFYVDGLKKTLKPLALSGLFFGIGAACKWTSIYAGAGLAVLLGISLVSRYLDYVQVNARDNDADKARVREFWPMTIRTLLWCVLFFIVIPFTIYFASYTPYFIYESGQATSYGLGDMFKTFGHYQQFMYNYHSTLNATHPYQSSWYSWPFTIKPMWYFFNSYIAPEQVSTLSASGNPAVWWVSAIGSVALLWARLSKRVAPDKAMQIFCVGILANFLPWVLVTRCTFIYHFFATVPFILMATVYALQKLEQRYPEAHFLKWFWVGFAVLFFVLLYPGISGLAVPADWAAFISKLPGGKLMYGA